MQSLDLVWGKLEHFINRIFPFMISELDLHYGDLVCNTIVCVFVSGHVFVEAYVH